LILPDGTWVAVEIELFGDNRALHFEFVGIVQDTNPWQVGGIPLVVDRETEIKGQIVVGMRVKVKCRILPDGRWLAIKIKPAFKAEPGQGCLNVSVPVVGVSPDQVQLRNWPSINLHDNILIDGEIAVGSILLLQICVGDDGTFYVTSIIVILPSPPPPPPMPSLPCGPCRGGATHLTLRYVGSIANAHIQVLQKKKGIVFDGMVQPGGTFAFGGTGKQGKLDKEIVIVVNGQANTNIHTSCSKPIAPGIVIGDFQVVAGYSKEGGPFCPEPIPSASPSKKESKGGSKAGSKGGSK
jgi:hypothetical protein